LILSSLIISSFLETRNNTPTEEILVKSPVTNVTQQLNNFEVVTSLSIPADLAQQVIGELFMVTSIVSGFEDLHTYEPTTSEIIKVQQADLFIRLGLGSLEPWIANMINDLDPRKVLTLVDASAGEYMLKDPLLGENNTHVWMDPSNAKHMTGKIYNKLVELDPDNEVSYTDNYNGYIDELDNLLNFIKTKKLVLKDTKVVVHHPAFMYLLVLLDIDRVGVIEESHESEPSAQHINEIIQIMNYENVSLLVGQSQIDEGNIVEIARETGAKIAELTPLLQVEVDDWEKTIVETYTDMIEYNIWALENPHDPQPMIIPSTGIIVHIIAVVSIITWKKRLKVIEE
jgi:ABC-type Zn uptake system ZnuABC Zn-binding protein ZnuA